MFQAGCTVLDVWLFGGWFAVAGLAAPATLLAARVAAATSEPVLSNCLVVISGGTTRARGRRRGELGQAAQLIGRAAWKSSGHSGSWHPGHPWHTGHAAGDRPLCSLRSLPGCDTMLLKEPADMEMDLRKTCREKLVRKSSPTVPDQGFCSCAYLLQQHRVLQVEPHEDVLRVEHGRTHGKTRPTTASPEAAPVVEATALRRK